VSRDGAAVTTIAPLAPAESPAWETDATIAEAADVVEQPSWTSADWPVEATDEAELPSTWADPDPRDDNPVRWSDEVDVAGAETAGNDDAANAHIAILDPCEHADHLIDTPQQPTPVTPRSAVEAAVAPLLRAASAGGAPAPVVVVITPEMLTAAPPRREAELERAVRRLEKKIATLTAAASDPRPQRPSRPKPVSTSATSRSTSHTTAPLTLTAAEQRALRALAAKRSAPITARRRARIILRAARGLSTATIATQVGVSQSTVRRWRARFATDRLAMLGDDLRTPATRARNTSRR
jgi:DNA-binding transcriptional regulator YiaG